MSIGGWSARLSSKRGPPIGNTDEDRRASITRPQVRRPAPPRAEVAAVDEGFKQRIAAVLSPVGSAWRAPLRSSPPAGPCRGFAIGDGHPITRRAERLWQRRRGAPPQRRSDGDSDGSIMVMATS
jgi:hypothetical protein